ncbi:MAG: TonB-dependent receptor [Oxalicibacterium faecigallinarum]|uniref:TonB-dependent receptor plug domain-containing protein n=1 Tax=Oxalicibacterium faecigallinarum TaxID=573741 RepID=UPI002807BC0B|nr:TonB-dependent receptor [Oxalicibacterium faecigallinarum]MDQ7970245.1 TonB-dependent receptor [Oxalicibacterium faecigallinarum]
MTYLASTPFRMRLQFLAPIVAISATFPATAQNTDSTLDPVVVTATRTEQKLSDVLSDVIVITSEEITQSGQTSLVDLLRTQRSIEVSGNGGAGTDASVFVRGSSSSQVVLLIDGVRNNSLTSGGPVWSTVPLSQIERIEIVLGPLSTMYGADAVGGVIQVFTKKGKGEPRLSFSAGAGSYGEQVFTAGVSGATLSDKPFRYAINVSSEKADSFSATLPHSSNFNPDKDGYDKQSLSGQFAWEYTKGHELGATFLNSRNDFNYDTGPLVDAFGRNEVNSYSAFSRNRFTTNWTSLFQVARSYTNTSASDLWGDARYDSRQEMFTWQNDLKFGANAFQILTERRNEEVSSSEQNLNRERHTNSIAGSYQFRNGRHLVSMSARHDDSSIYGNHLTGSVGYGYEFARSWRLSASYGTNFRAPTFNELYFPFYGSELVRPEKGRNAELGLHYDDGVSKASAVLYQNKIRDLIAYDSNCGCAANIEEALLSGLSLNGRTKLNNSTSLYAAFDLQDPKNRSSDALLARRAKQHGSVGFDYRMVKFTGGANVLFSGYRYDDAANTTRLGGYALLNLHASYDLSKDWQLFGRWNNVLNKDYELSYGYQTPGSNVFLGIRYGFK